MRELPQLSGRHLLGAGELSRQDILAIFRTALWMRNDYLRTGKRADMLANRTIVNLFAENSTRTRSSFLLAETRLGAQTLNFSSDSSSFSKGETLLDTVWNIEAMHVDGIVVRHKMAGTPWFLAKHCSSVIINAGDGRHEHPTQGLLDTLTLYERWHNEEAANDSTGFEGKKVTIVGDITHGRVALSNIYALQTLGSQVTVCGPPTLIPRGIEQLGVNVSHSLGDAIREADAVMMLRMQHERQERAFFPSLKEYTRLFGLNRSNAIATSPECSILHPGPINRGVELDSETADGPQSVILKQVENGVAIRMAVLVLLLGNSSQTG